MPLTTHGLVQVNANAQYADGQALSSNFVALNDAIVTVQGALTALGATTGGKADAGTVSALQAALTALQAVVAAKADAAALTALSATVGTKADSSAVTTLDGSVTALQTAVGTKAAAADLAALSGTVGSLTTTVAAKANTSALSSYLPLSGGTLTGGVTIGGSLTATGVIQGTLIGDGSRVTNLSASNLTTGHIGQALIGGGTYGTTTYLRGDSTWQPLSGLPKPTLDQVLSVGSTSYTGIGVGSLNLYKNNSDYSDTLTSAGIVLNNDNYYGQNIISSVIGGQVKAKWRTDYVGNISWVAGQAGSHTFYVGGDYPNGRIALNVTNDGTAHFNYPIQLSDGTQLSLASTGTVGVTYYGQPAGIQCQGFYFPGGASLQGDGSGGILYNGQPLGSSGSTPTGGGASGSLRVQEVTFYFQGNCDYYGLYWLIYSDSGAYFDYQADDGSAYQFSQGGQQSIAPDYMTDTGFSGYFYSDYGYVFGRVIQAHYEYYTAGGQGDHWYLVSDGDNGTNMGGVPTNGTPSFGDIAADYFGQ